MEFKLNLMKVVLLLLGCTLLIFTGFADEKGRSIEERQMIEEDELPDADTVENVIEKSPKFPRDMYIPDSDKAEYPELTHFQYRYYFREVDEYSDTELRFFGGTYGEDRERETVEMTDRDGQKEEERGILRELGGWIVYILIIVGLTYLIITFVGQRTRVSGSSMETTLSDGDNLIVDKLSYHFKEPKRFDIIVFPYKHEKNTYYIKRIIGLPGDTVQVIDGYVYIDGELLESDIYGAEVMMSADLAAEPIQLGEDEYFVLGDNRNHSSDSRDPSVGVLKREDLIGRAWVRIYPFNKMGVIRHE